MMMLKRPFFLSLVLALNGVPTSDWMEHERHNDVDGVCITHQVQQRMGFPLLIGWSE
jgi:hypothetical protein